MDPSYDRPIDPARSLPVQLRPAGPLASIPAGSVVFDGAAGALFRPQTVFLALDGAPDLAGAVPIVSPDGGCSIRVLGTNIGGFPWERRFTLGRGRSALLDVSPYNDVRIELLDAAPAGRAILGFVSTGQINVNDRAHLYYAASYPVAGLYTVPPGADVVYPAVLDAGFTWRGLDAAPFNVAPPGGAVVGVPLDVMGQAFTTVVAPWSAVWRIRP